MRVGVSDDESADSHSGGEEEREESHLANALDIIEHRYGWTDEQVLALPYLRFLEVLRIASKAELATAERDIYNAAFTAWQIVVSRPRQARAKKPKTFKQWTEDLGLGKKRRKEVTQEEVTRAAVKARNNAEKVRATFARRSP